MRNKCSRVATILIEAMRNIKIEFNVYQRNTRSLGK